MPTPLGHALGAAAAGWAVARPLPASVPLTATLRRGAWFALLGMFPDVDLLLTIGRLWGEAAAQRIQFSDPVSARRSKLVALLGLRS